ncbi:MAG: serine/threonine protein kinase/WD40 repeat protein [Planctomycetota bacterium]|jgi:serine/threonine protein kinase/WD40 repeat protein
MTPGFDDDGSALEDARELELAALVEAFEEARRGDPLGVTIESWAVLHPEFAVELKELLPGLLLMETVAAETSESMARRAEIESIPEAIGEYRILEQIGRGGMGTVYLAEQGSLGRTVALKVLPGNLDLGGGFLERFQREARAAAQLMHPHIVPVYGAGQADGRHYFAMRYIDGASLDERLREMRAASAADDQGSRPSGLPIRDVVRIASEVAGAIAHAHAAGVLHRDIKPGNILLDDEGKAWVTDFGLCRVEDAGNLTTDGSILGTLRYMAPEQIEGAADERSDVYGVGLVLFELLTLRPAFDSVKRSKVVHDVLHSPLPRIRRLRRDVPRPLEIIVQKAAAKLPQERYATAAALQRDLEAFLHDRPISARPPSALYLARLFTSRHRMASVVAVVAVCLLSLLATKYVHDLRASQAESERRGYVGDLAAAEAALREGATTRARYHLDQAPEGLRSWEWAHLNARIDQSVNSVQLADGELLKLAVRPDGLLVAVATVSGFTLVSLPDLEPIAQIRTGKTRGMAWDALGERLAVCLSDGRVQLYGRGDESEFDLLAESRIPQERRREPREVLFVGDDILFGTTEGNLVRWQVATGKLMLQGVLSGEIVGLGSLPQESSGTRGAAEKDGGSFWAASADADLVLFTGGERAGSTRLDVGERQVRDVVLAGTGRGVAITKDGGAYRFQLGGNERRKGLLATHEIHRSDGEPTGVTMDGDIAVVVGVDKLVHVLDLVNDGELRALSGSPHPLRDVAFVPASRALLTAGSDGWLRVWDRAVAGGGLALRGHLNDVNSLAFSPNGERLITGGRDGMVIVWDVARAEPIEVFTEPVATVSAVGFFGPEGNESYFAGTVGGHYFLWHPISDDGGSAATVVESGTAAGGIRDCVRDARSGGIFVATSRGIEVLQPQGLRTSQVSTFASLARLMPGEDIVSATVADDWLVAVTRAGQVSTFDAATKAPVATFETGFRTNGSQVSATEYSQGGATAGRRVLFVTAQHEVVTLDLASGATRVIFASRSSDGALGEIAMEATWIEGGDRILVTTRNGLVSVWDPETAEHLLDLRGHEFWGMRIKACDATGWIVSLSSHMGVRLWHTETTAQWAERLDKRSPVDSKAARGVGAHRVSRAAVLDSLREELSAGRGRVDNRDWMLVASLYRMQPGDVRSEALYAVARSRFDRSVEVLTILESCRFELEGDADYEPILDRTIDDLWDVASWRDAMRGRLTMDERGWEHYPPQPWEAVNRSAMVYAPFLCATPLRTLAPWGMTLMVWLSGERSPELSLPASLARFLGR